MFYKPLSTRRTLFALVGIPILWFMIWLALTWLAQFVGIRQISGTDTAAFLALVGGIMGAIFTVGGLIIALVAVLTQLQLQDRVTQVLAQSRKELEEKFEKELRPKYEEEAQRQIEGTLAFFQATLAGNWSAAERLTRQALDKYPKLQGARSFLGLRMAAEVIADYNRTLHQQEFPLSGFLMQPDSEHRDREGRLFTIEYKSPSRSASSMAGIYAGVSSPEPPKLQAVKWLEEALQHDDNPDGQVSAALALMYGVNGAYDLMLPAIQDALNINPTQRDYLTGPTSLAMLLYAADGDRTRIIELGHALNYHLPAHLSSIRQSVDAINMKSTQQYVDWYAMGVWGAQQSSRFPALIRIFRRDESAGEPQVFAYVFPHRGQQYSFPPPNTEDQSQPYLPLSDFVSQFSRNYMFICPVLGPQLS